LKSAATDGRFLIFAIMDDRKNPKSAAADGRFLISRSWMIAKTRRMRPRMTLFDLRDHE
jgi:hypothetical protein